MPPKPKVTKEEVAAAALAIVKEKGIVALTARELGRRLGTSSCPIFTVFQNMEDVKRAARTLGLREFEEYASDFVEYTPAFKRIGMLMVSYSIHQPEMFKLLFMQEHSESQSFENIIADLGGIADTCIKLIQKDYDMTPEEARILFEQMWVYTFGMGAMCAMKVCDFTEDEIAQKLGCVFAGLVMVIRTHNLENIFYQPEKNSEGFYHGKSVHDLPFIHK